MSKIQWTEKTWNVTVGCSKTSEGCQKCYAIKDAHRMAGNPNPKISNVYSGLTERRGDRTEWTGQVKFIPERLEIPLRTRKPTMWFVNSMSDLWHESVTDEQLDQIFAVMALTPQHIYQCLTKRPQRMRQYLTDSGTERRIFKTACGFADEFSRLKSIPHQWPMLNLWLGVTCENQKAADERIPLLLQTPAAVRFLSCEPLLEEIDLTALDIDGFWLNTLTGEMEDHGQIYPALDQIITGGESGHGARPCNIEWVRSIVEQCREAGVACFVKQLGSNPFSPHNPMWDNSISGKGGNPEEWPEWARVRQFPQVRQLVSAP